MAVKKYKPTQTPHMFQQGTEDGNARAVRVSNAAQATIAHTRQLLQHSRELIERTKARATSMQATGEHHHELERKPRQLPLPTEKG